MRLLKSLLIILRAISDLVTLWDCPTAWTSDAKIHQLSQLHEEGRYTRRFHHTVFSVSMTLYAGVSFLQIKLLMDTVSAPISLEPSPFILIKVIAPLVFLIIVPIILLFMFINWHFVQGNIRDKIVALQEELGFPKEYIDIKYKGFTNLKWWQKLFTGRGHIAFIILLVVIVILNFLMFKIISAGITKL